MNPALSFGPDLVLLNFIHYWVYVVGPMAGAMLAVLAAYALRGPGGDEPAVQAAQGRLEASPISPATPAAARSSPREMSAAIPELAAILRKRVAPE